MATLLEGKMFRNHNSSLLKLCTVNQSVLCITAFRKVCYFVIQPFVYHTLFFVNNGLLGTSNPHPLFVICVQQCGPQAISEPVMWASCGLKLVNPALCYT